MEVRVLTEADRESAASLFLDVFSNEPWNDDWSDQTQFNAYLSDLLDQNHSLGFGCFENGRLIGLAMGFIKHWYGGTEYNIDEFCIAANMQGKGIGTAFLKEIEAYLYKKGITSIFLQTERDVQAFAFYQKSGFRELKNHVSLTKDIKE